MHYTKLIAALATSLLVSSGAFAGAMIPITNVIYDGTPPPPPNNSSHWSSNPVDIGFNIKPFSDYPDFFISELKVSNGHLFANSLRIPWPGYSNATIDIKPLNDIDLIYGGTVTYGSTTYNGRAAFAASWIDVVASADPEFRNSFQLVLVDRSDVNEGDFDLVLNYDSITGCAVSSLVTCSISYQVSVNTYNNDRSNQGYTSASSFVIFRDYGATKLPYYSLNSDVAGRYVFEVRDGQVPQLTAIATVLSAVPEPETYAMLLVGLGLVTQIARRRRQQNR